MTRKELVAAGLPLTCSACLALKPVTDFTPRADTGSRNSRCHACRAAGRTGPKRMTKKARIRLGLPLHCPKCGENKPHDQFSTNPNGSPVSHCKACKVKETRDYYRRKQEERNHAA